MENSKQKDYNSYDLLVTFNSTYKSRLAGTVGELQAGLYIRSLLEKMGYEVQQQSFSLRGNHSQNFIATKYGTNQENRNTLVVGTHYDCVSAGFGIDDNASGVAIVLEAAQYFATHPSEFTIVFAFWGAEECGLVGSKFYVNNLSENQLKKILLYINLDSLIAGDYNYVHASEDVFARSILRMCEAESEIKIQQGLHPDYPFGTAYPDNDHLPFEKKGIPYVYFESTNWEIDELDGFTQTASVGSIWHTGKDKLEYMEKQFPGRINKSLEIFKWLLIKILSDYVYRR